MSYILPFSFPIHFSKKRSSPISPLPPSSNSTLLCGGGGGGGRSGGCGGGGDFVRGKKMDMEMATPGRCATRRKGCVRH